MNKVPKEISKYMSTLARKGHQVTYKKRYEIIKELTAFTSKKFLDSILHWKTKELEVLLEEYKNK